MRIVIFVMAAFLCFFGLGGLLGELVAFNFPAGERGMGIAGAFGSPFTCVPVLIGLVFCCWRVQPQLTPNEKLTVLVLAAPELLSMAGLAVWSLLGR